MEVHFSWGKQRRRRKIKIAFVHSDTGKHRLRQANCVCVKSGTPLRQQLAGSGLPLTADAARVSPIDQDRRTAVGPVKPLKLRASRINCIKQHFAFRINHRDDDYNRGDVLHASRSNVAA